MSGYASESRGRDHLSCARGDVSRARAEFTVHPGVEKGCHSSREASPTRLTAGEFACNMSVSKAPEIFVRRDLICILT